MGTRKRGERKKERIGKRGFSLGPLTQRLEFGVVSVCYRLISFASIWLQILENKGSSFLFVEDFFILE